MPLTPIALSVIVCTHNPRQEYLSRTLEALRKQSLSLEHWELLIIDNGSTPAVTLDLGWHPFGCLLREDKIGLTNARVCGIGEASADLLVFVDDDNLLNPDYLVCALEIEREWPRLGTWGGQCFPEFERAPEEWTRQYWNWIAIRQFAHDRWSNIPKDSGAIPCGAGMCVRRAVAESYVALLEHDLTRRALDRTGEQLFAGGDTDLCLTACDLGLGNGIFTALRLTHLIPARRLEEGYLLALVEAMTYSYHLLQHVRGQHCSYPSRSQRLLRWYESLHLSPRERRFESAKQRGAETAQKEIERLQRNALSKTAV